MGIKIENNIANEISMNFSLNESDTKKNIIEKTIKTAFVKIDWNCIFPFERILKIVNKFKIINPINIFL